LKDQRITGLLRQFQTTKILQKLQFFCWGGGVNEENWNGNQSRSLGFLDISLKMDYKF
jgi:hypothetical protein